MIKHIGIKVGLGCIAALLIVFQALILFVAEPKDYYLIYDWIFYAVNYLIIIALFFLFASKRRYLVAIQILIVIVFLVMNTTYLYYKGDENIVVSHSQHQQHEVILKESKKMKDETVSLKRRGVIFGKKVTTLTGSSRYKAIEKDRYQIEWVSGDIAILTYQTNVQGALKQSIFSFRASDYSSYYYVIVSLTGKWVEKDHSQNYLMSNNGELIYAKEGHLYYYSQDDIEQQGVFSIIVTGDQHRPSFTVVLNADSELDKNAIVKKGGTITVSPISLDQSKGKVFEKQ
ncbi:hypothetical protein JOD43_004103 [Pullulanibacillus pueri]|uniref:Uncharacterized protein n=1 Tax=Pullulanibacillus pueri TaxID=1437324 RepID=A0A8J2ZZM5_9BACL|nr:hypothetical protein [Pullulanibacillus pueri]MBM7683907.1 hypothetical protein [Pullulanibacillus pueri]GGH87812.1 hypothetical protein GCM10007096_38690 [Pullulanibacillus pueri]